MALKPVYYCRSSALRSSQNSLQSSVANSQRPASAYYPPPVSVATSRPNLHQSIPNLKSPPSNQRLQTEENRAGSYPSVNQHHPHPNYPGQNYPTYHPDGRNYNPNPQFSANSYPSPTHQTPVYPNNVPPHVHSNGQRQEEGRYNNVGGGGGLIREDLARQSQNSRHDEVMRYLSNNNPRLDQARLHDDLSRQNEMRSSKSEDMLKNPVNHHNNDMMRYASSGNIRTHESSKVEIPLYRMKEDEDELRQMRPQKPVDNVEGRKRPNRLVGPYPQQPNQAYQHPPNNYYQQQQQYYNQNNPAYNYNMQMAQNTQSMQNLNLNQAYQQNYPNYHHANQYYPNSPTSPTYKSPPIAPKPAKKMEEPPELPPTNTHPLYSASTHDPPKMAFYPTSSGPGGKTPRDPWAREEQERQAEVRREASRQWQEEQIRQLLMVPHRTCQQEEQLRVLQLEREFQRRALEESEQDDDDTEKVGH